MGCAPSKNELKVVQDVTGMSKSEAKTSFTDFKKETGSSKIKLDKFTKLISTMNTNKGQCDLADFFFILPKKNIFPGDATEYSKHLFRALDSDKDNMVSWKEVMVGLHHLSPNGDPEKKLLLVFDVRNSEKMFS